MKKIKSLLPQNSSRSLPRNCSLRNNLLTIDENMFDTNRIAEGVIIVRVVANGLRIKDNQIRVIARVDDSPVL